MRSRDKRARRKEVRHPGFTPSGDQRRDALRRLALDAVARAKRKAAEEMTYYWEARDGGTCSECSEPAAKLVDGLPPPERPDLLTARGVCLPCASNFEHEARQTPTPEVP